MDVGMTATAELEKITDQVTGQMSGQAQARDSRSGEESGRGGTWSEHDTRCLIAIWTDPLIQTQLKGFLRNNAVYDEICRRLRECGVYRTAAQCRNKTKNLRKGFRQLKLRLGPYSKSVTRQSSIFYKELDRVWGKDYSEAGSGEGETKEGHAADFKDLEFSRESEEASEMYESCSAEGGSLSEMMAAGHYEPHPEEARSEKADHEGAPTADFYCHQQGVGGRGNSGGSGSSGGGGYSERDRLGPLVGALQQVNQHSMERLKEAVLELNRSFLEQQSLAEERREKASRDHEIRLFEMFLNRGGSNSHPVYPVTLGRSGKCPCPQTPHPTRLSEGCGPSASDPSGVDAEASGNSPSSMAAMARAPAVCSSPMHCLALRLHPGDEIKSCLARLVRERGIQAACIVSCVGSVRCAELRLADSKTILKLASNHEIVSLVGTMSTSGMHLHTSLADEEGKVVGGHVMGNMEVFTTAEIVIGELPNVTFRREMDEDTGYRELQVDQEEDIAEDNTPV